MNASETESVARYQIVEETGDSLGVWEEEFEGTREEVEAHIVSVTDELCSQITSDGWVWGKYRVEYTDAADSRVCSVFYPVALTVS